MQETTYILKTSIYGLKVNETNKTALCNGVFETKTNKTYGVRALEVIFYKFLLKNKLFLYTCFQARILSENLTQCQDDIKKDCNYTEVEDYPELRVSFTVKG